MPLSPRADGLHINPLKPLTERAEADPIILMSAQSSELNVLEAWL